MVLEALRLAENFFSGKPEVLPTVRAFLLGALERWPEVQIVTQKSQVGLRDPRPFCALWLHTHGGIRRRPGQYVLLSLFLPRPLESPRVAQAVEPYPGRWTNHLILTSPEDLDQELWDWVAEARRFRCGGKA